jgi:hypothetical protein
LFNLRLYPEQLPCQPLAVWVLWLPSGTVALNWRKLIHKLNITGGISFPPVFYFSCGCVNKFAQPIFPPGKSRFSPALDDNAASLQSTSSRPAWEMYRFDAQVVPFGGKELDWQTG